MAAKYRPSGDMDMHDIELGTGMVSARRNSLIGMVVVTRNVNKAMAVASLYSTVDVTKSDSAKCEH